MVFGTAVVYDLIARDKASRTFHKVAGSASRAESGFGKMGAAARRAAVDIGAAGVAIGVVSVKMATDFQSSMTKVQSMAGGSAKDVRELSKQVLNLGKYAEQSPKELADSLYHLKSVGMDNVSAMKALKQSADLAAVGGNSLEETTNALAGAWRSGIKGAGNFRGAVGTLNAIVGAGNMKMEDLTAAMGTGFLPTAKSFGVSLKEVGAALALMTDEGVPADAAATRLRMSMSLLAAPSGAAEKVLSGIGVSGHQLGETLRKPNGLIKTIQLLKTHLRGLDNYYPNQQKADAFVAKWKDTVAKLLKDKPKGGYTTAQSMLIDQYGMAKQHEILKAGALDAAEQAAVLSKAFGGGRSSSAILTMINNLDVLKKKQDQINGSIGKFGDSVKTQRQTAEAQFKLLRSSLDVLAIKLGDALLPWAVKLVRYLNKQVMPELDKFVNWFDKKGAPGISRFVTAAKPFVKGVLEKTRDILKEAAPYAKDFVEAFDKLPKGVKTGLGEAALLGFGAKKLGLFKLLGTTKGKGGLGGGSGLLGMASKAKPIPVYVTNKGFGVPGTPGTPTPSPKVVPSVANRIGKVAGEALITAAIIKTGNAVLQSVFNGGGAKRTIGNIKTANALGGSLKGIHLPGLGGTMEYDAEQSIKKVDAALANLVRTGNVQRAQAAFAALKDEAKKQGVSVKQLTDEFPAYQRALDKIPPTRVTKIGLSGFDQAYANVSKYGSMLDGLNRTVRTTFVTNIVRHHSGAGGTTDSGETVGKRSPTPTTTQRTATGGVSVNIGTVVAHDYQDFMTQAQRRARRAALDGIRP